MAVADLYEPAEDSFLLAKHIPQRVYGAVLDMGTGSGILADTAAQSKKVHSVLAVDINLQALRTVKNLDRREKEHQHRKKIRILKSDLFAKLGSKKFDVILFNPPYLPELLGEQNDMLTKAIVGGKKGWETIARFMGSVSPHLTPTGTILLLFSSQTNTEKVLDCIGAQLFDAKQIASQRLFYESLYVYQIQKSRLLRELEQKGFSSIARLAAGKRGVVYRARHRGKDCAIKVQKENGTHRTDNEVKWLQRLNRRGVGPQYLQKGKNYFVMEYVDGTGVWEFIRDNDKTEIKKLIRKVFDQCSILDTMGVNKFEMHHPHKHIKVRKDGSVILIDFERCRETEDPKNVTQFVQFITSTNFQVSLMGKNIWMHKERLRRLAQFYKNNRNEKSLDKIFKEIR